jgi:hypothetical protein
MAKRKQSKDTSAQEVESKGRPKESSTFESIFTQYGDSIAALREFFSRVNPFVAKKKRGIEKERKAYVKELIRDFGQRASEAETEELKNFIESRIVGITKKSKTARTFKAKDITSPLTKEFAVKLVRAIFYDTPSDVHRELLNKSILLSLVSYFELLVADLAHAFYRIAPDAISTDDKVLSVNELKQLSSIDEALRAIVSDRVDKLLRGSVGDWQEFFQSRMKIDMKLLTPDWAQWNEYFQRRHIAVHAGGRVTQLYLSKLDWEALAPYMVKPSLGDKLDIDDAYLENAINTFEVSGLLLCQEVWKKLVPKDSEARYGGLRGLGDAVYRRLLSRHWYVAEKLATWGEKDGETSEDYMLICKFNRWLCMKRQGRWTEIEDEVKAFDCSAKHRRFALARASLLQQADEFFEILPKALAAEDITIEYLKEWPILDEMRGNPRFAEVIK